MIIHSSFSTFMRPFKKVFRPPSDGGLMIPQEQKNDVLVKRLVIFLFYFFFLSGKFHEKFVRKISCRKHASAWPCSVLLGSAWPCLVPVASLVGGPGGPWPPQNFRIFFLFIDKNLCKNCVYTFCVYFIPRI